MTVSRPRPVLVAAHAYPWDVEGDPAFVDRVAALGVTEVTLAAAYHSTRAASPMHPAHQLVEARHAALYRPRRDAAWAGQRLTPGVADWMQSADSFAEATASLCAAGFRVTAWVVLTHSSRLGTAHPDVAVRNCFGDRYSYALCPSSPEVQDYAVTLATEAVQGVPVTGVSLEACGQLGVGHNGLHEKSDGAFGAAAARVLSVCCCTSCCTAWSERGLDATRTVALLRASVVALRDGAATDDATMAELVGVEVAESVLATRFAATDALRDAVLSALAAVAPEVRITLHGDPDPWGTGAATALTPATAAGVDAVLVPAWPQTSASLDAISSARSMLPDRVAVGAYITVLPPADAATGDGHAAALLDAGADELHLYHLGLAPPAGLEAIGRIAHALQVGI